MEREPAVAAVVAAFAFLAVVSSAAVDDCSVAVSYLFDCLEYVTNGSAVSAPSAACCSGVRGFVTKSPECICVALQQATDFGVAVNTTRIFGLPAVCSVKASVPDCGAAAPSPSPVSSSPAPSVSPSPPPISSSPAPSVPPSLPPRSSPPPPSTSPTPPASPSPPAPDSPSPAMAMPPAEAPTESSSAADAPLARLLLVLANAAAAALAVVVFN